MSNGNGWMRDTEGSISRLRALEQSACCRPLTDGYRDRQMATLSCHARCSLPTQVRLHQSMLGKLLTRPRRENALPQIPRMRVAAWLREAQIKQRCQGGNQHRPAAHSSSFLLPRPLASWRKRGNVDGKASHP